MTEPANMGQSSSPIARKVLGALLDGELSERDLYVRLRPVDRVGLHRALAELDRDRLVAAHVTGTLPGPNVTTYRLTDACRACLDALRTFA
jgi:DNA-binding HxlR family transcriptional regulator